MGTSDAEFLTPHDAKSVQFFPVRFKDSYSMEDADDFLELVISDLELRWKARTVPAGSPERAAVARYRLDAAAVRDHTFQTVRWREGYDMEQVDVFLDRIQHTFQSHGRRRDLPCRSRRTTTPNRTRIGDFTPQCHTITNAP